MKPAAARKLLKGWGIGQDALLRQLAHRDMKVTPEYGPGKKLVAKNLAFWFKAENPHAGNVNGQVLRITPLGRELITFTNTRHQ